MPPDPIEYLNRLIQVNKDSEAGFRTAAENIKNSELESIFIGYAKQHAKFAHELELDVEKRGGKASESGTLGGALHRGWMDLKSGLSGASPHAMLSSCESGAESAEVAYHDAWDAIATGASHSMIDKQWQQVKEIRKRLARLAAETKDGLEFQKNE